MANPLGKLTDSQILAEYERRVAWRKMYRYEPYDWQREFHNAGGNFTQRAILAGNRCLTRETLIDTPQGLRSVGDIFEAGQPFEVFAWDGSKIVRTMALAPFKKPDPAPCYRLNLPGGRWVECSGAHRIFLDGSWQSVQSLLASGQVPPASSLARGQPIRGASALHWWRKLRDFLAGYPFGRRSGDVRPRPAAGSAQGFVPSQGDAPERPCYPSRMGDRACKYTHSRPESGDRLSIRGALRRLADLCAGFSAPAFWPPVQLLTAKFAAFPQSSIAGASALRSGRARFSRFPSAAPLSHACPPLIFDANKIVSYETIGVHDVYDFTVPGLHNYVAGGIIHHNTGKTWSAATETAIHLTGDYPEWWEGHRFKRPPLMWAGSITNQASRDICQRELLGETTGTGIIPGDRIVGQPTYRQAGIPNVVDVVRVKHKTGGVSVLQFKTYEQGWRVWQGSPVDGIWLDEEPDESSAQKGIFNEALTRILSTNGIIYCTFTPLLGETDLVLHFMSGKPGTHVTMASWDQAAHLDKDLRAQLLSSYPEWERDTRSKGVPMMGEGRVWKVTEDEIKCRPFEIPDHFARIVGIDFGTDHPFAAVWLAWDRDNDVLYVYDALRVANQTPTYHAEGIKRRGAEIPVAWPHDGVNTEKSSGKALYLHYRDAGLNMLSMSARYENDKGGGQPVEPIVLDFDERFRTGGLKVFAHLHQWFEEYRSYHRKGGKIVPVKDDLLKATMYGAMMKRYAAPKTIRRRVKHYKGPIVASPV